MKIKPGFEVHTVCGQDLIMGMGEQNIDFSKVITLNETSRFIWDKLKDGVDSVDSLVGALTSEYEVDEQTARNDIEALIAQFVELGVMEG